MHLRDKEEPSMDSAVEEDQTLILHLGLFGHSILKFQ